MPSTLDWLRARDDRALVALLRARPDLTVPAPGDLTVLAGRLNTGPSVWRAMESLNQFHIQVLQALAVLNAEKRAVPLADLRKLLGKKVPAAALDEALDKLEGLALVRGTDTIHMPSAVLAVLGPYPAGLGAPGKLTVAEAKAAVETLDPTSRGILDRLTTGIPRGTTDPKSAIARAVTALITAGLLRRVDADTVELPREVGLALRGDEPLGPIRVDPPKDTVREHGVRTVDGTGGGQALATVDRLGRLLEAIGQNPPPALKSGGLGRPGAPPAGEGDGHGRTRHRAGCRGARRRRVDRRGGRPGPGHRILDADHRCRRFPGRTGRGGLGADRGRLARPAAQPLPGRQPGRQRQGAERAVPGAVLDPRSGRTAIRAERARRTASRARASTCRRCPPGWPGARRCGRPNSGRRCSPRRSPRPPRWAWSPSPR